jgi:hypothetical protein
MSSCTSCSSQLKPEWKFCVYCGTPAIPGAIRPEPVETQRFNPLAILATILAALGGAPALIFGHIAMKQITVSGERGMVIAQLATVAGYGWVVVWGVLIANLYLNALR